MLYVSCLFECSVQSHEIGPNFSPHFRGEEVKAQRDKITYAGPTAGKRSSGHLNFHILSVAKSCTCVLLFFKICSHLFPLTIFVKLGSLSSHFQTVAAYNWNALPSLGGPCPPLQMYLLELYSPASSTRPACFQFPEFSMWFQVCMVCNFFQYFYLANTCSILKTQFTCLLFKSSQPSQERLTSVCVFKYFFTCLSSQINMISWWQCQLMIIVIWELWFIQCLPCYQILP